MDLGLRKLKYQKNKIDILKDNIQIWVKGFGWAEWKTFWSKGGKSLSVSELAKRLKEIIKATKDDPWPEKPEPPVSMRKEMPIMGTQTSQAKELDEKAARGKVALEKRARKKWKSNEDSGFGSIHSSCLLPEAPNMDEKWIGKKIEFLHKFWLNKEETEFAVRWCSGTIERISDGTWLLPEAWTQCYEVGEAAEIY